MKLVFRKSSHHLQSLTEIDCPALSLRIFGQPLIVWNIGITLRTKKIDKIMIPEDFPDAIRLVQNNFPSIEVEKVSDVDNYDLTGAFTDDAENILRIVNDTMEIPINSILRKPRNSEKILIELFDYPWNFLNAIKKILQDEVTQTIISKNAIIAKSTIIEGPCIIEDNVTIDDFCKIKGPIYIGRDSFIGMGSLVRGSMLGNQTRFGFNCEISKSYFTGNAKIAHHNVILDSVIGENVWFGGYTGTANVLLTRKNIKYMIDDNLVDTGTDHFGSLVGNNCAVGASVIILPGRQVPANAQIQAGTIFGKDK